MPPGERGGNKNWNTGIDKMPETGTLFRPQNMTEAQMQRLGGIELGRYVGEGRDGTVCEVREDPNLVAKWWKPTFSQAARRNELGLHEIVMDKIPDLVPRLLSEISEESALRGFVMERIPGTPLGDVLIKTHATPDPSFIFDLQTLLDEVWSVCHVAHGDPHPWNILIHDPQIEIDEDTRKPVLYGAGKIWLIDFSRGTMTAERYQMDKRMVAARLRGFDRTDLAQASTRLRP